ncbi:hypothetical protein ABFA07_022448 [Porites harrisoni]
MSGLALEAMDRKQVTALVLLDLSKAFDSIDHMSLLKKLRAMGTSKEAREWFRSYLIGRKQSVRIGCETSEPRIVSGTRKFDHVIPILKQLQWLPIVKQLEVRDAIMVFKYLNGLAPPYLCQKFKTRSEVHNCNTRNRDRLHIPLCRTAAGQRAFTFRGQRLWNSLPNEFQSITNLDVFKVKIKQHFLRAFLEN